MYRLPFEKLDTENKEELLNTIKETKLRLKELRDVMEHPNYKCTKCPSELTMHKCERDFLNMAIVRYIALGGEYSYDSKELADREFNNKLENIVKISIKNGYWNEYKPNVIIELAGKKIICKVLAGIDYVEKDVDYDKKDFLCELRNLHLGEWDEEYSTERFGLYYLDGTAWELQIEYKDGTKRICFGHNAYPYNFDELLNLVGENEKVIEEFYTYTICLKLSEETFEFVCKTIENNVKDIISCEYCKDSDVSRKDFITNKGWIRVYYNHEEGIFVDSNLDLSNILENYVEI